MNQTVGTVLSIALGVAVAALVQCAWQGSLLTVGNKAEASVAALAGIGVAIGMIALINRGKES